MKTRSGRLGRMRVTANGEGVASHAGTELLRELACSSGLVDEAASALARLASARSTRPPAASVGLWWSPLGCSAHEVSPPCPGTCEPGLTSRAINGASGTVVSERACLGQDALFGVMAAKP